MTVQKLNALNISSKDTPEKIKATIESTLKGLFQDFNAVVKFRYLNNGENFQIALISNENLRSAAEDIIKQSDVSIYYTTNQNQ